MLNRVASAGPNYNPDNSAWLFEFFAPIFGTTKTNLVLVHANGLQVINSGPDALPTYKAAHSIKSPEILRYEAAAKKSARLTAHETASPANIKYFQT